MVFRNGDAKTENPFRATAETEKPKRPFGPTVHRKTRKPRLREPGNPFAGNGKPVSETGKTRWRKPKRTSLGPATEITELTKLTELTELTKPTGLARLTELTKPTEPTEPAELTELRKLVELTFALAKF